MTDLDDPASYAIDGSGMFGHIERLGTEFETAWLQSAGMDIPLGPFTNMVVAAMGGSAAAADYFVSLVRPESPVPVKVVRGYELPGFVGPGSLTIALSYSGGTEEVLAGYEEALRRGTATLAISHGGDLLRAAEAAGRPSHRVAYESPPRAALPHLLAPLLRLAQALGISAVCDDDIAVAANAHRQLVANHIGRHIPEHGNAAKQLAHLLLEADPLTVIAAEHLAPVGRRTRNQFAENTKRFATFEEAPEATHNIIEALRRGETGHPVGVVLDSPRLHAGNRRRFELVSRLFEEAGGATAGLMMRGTSRLADMLEASAWGDYLSCYLAVLSRTDPTPTPGLIRVRQGMVGEAPV
jgi:glucose/mannose-6-phosphate isomerase